MAQVFGKTILPAEGGCPGSTKCDLIFFKISSNSFGGFCDDNQRDKIKDSGLPYLDQAIFWIYLDGGDPSIYFYNMVTGDNKTIKDQEWFDFIKGRGFVL